MISVLVIGDESKKKFFKEKLIKEENEEIKYKSDKVKE
jgi:hypothetical protein